jgi:acetylornithine deacetylase
MKAAEVRACVESLKGELFEMARELVQFPSVTGEETEAQQYIAGRWRDWGLAVDLWIPERSEVVGHPAFCDDGLPIERVNVVAQWGEGDPNHAGLILNGHMDVVPVGDLSGWDDDPFAGIIHHGILFGRGSCDMKSSLAAMSFAVRAAQELGITPKRHVLLQSVIGEETGGLGTLAAILRGYRADLAILGEPTSLTLCPVASGALSFRLRVPGRAAHGALPDTGVSAIDKFHKVREVLRDLETERHASFRHPAFKDNPLAAPLSIGRLRAGDWPSTVPDEAIAEGRFGVFPGEDIAAARIQFETTVRNASKKDDWLRNHPVQIEWFEGQFEPGETDPDTPLIKELARCHQSITGSQLRQQGVPYGNDLRLFTRHGNMPAVLYGPGDVLRAHAANESISLDEIVTATEVYTMLIATLEN